MKRNVLFVAKFYKYAPKNLTKATPADVLVASYSGNEVSRFRKL
jgi:hypothetical protein